MAYDTAAFLLGISVDAIQKHAPFNTQVTCRLERTEFSEGEAVFLLLLNIIILTLLLMRRFTYININLMIQLSGASLKLFDSRFLNLFHLNNLQLTQKLKRRRKRRHERTRWISNFPSTSSLVTRKTTTATWANRARLPCRVSATTHWRKFWLWRHATRLWWPTTSSAIRPKSVDRNSQLWVWC